MTKEKFYELLTAENKGSDIYSLLQQFGKKKTNILSFLEQYDPLQHKVRKSQYRPDKIVFKPTGELDQYGNVKTDDKGNVLVMKDTECVSRIPISAQEDITKNAAAILCTNPLKLTSKTEDDHEDLDNVWEANRMNYLILDMCEKWLSETEVAMLWYKDEDTSDLKVMILANSEGDTMYPVFDDKGKMICFGRSYKTKEVDATRIGLKEVEHVELYTDTQVFRADNSNGDFEFIEPVNHGFDKIPISYVDRDYPIWQNAQPAIEQTEKTISDLCDTNAYNASPILFGQGSILSMAAKGEAGKVIEGDKDSSLQYVTWDKAPESIRMELEILEAIICRTCCYVDLSLSKLKGLFGSAPSSYAIKLLFTPAHQQAARHEGVFGVFIQRALNIILSATGGKPDSIKPVFEYLLPKDEQTEVQTINTATQGGFLSTETATELSPLTQDTDKEYQRLKDETAAAAKAAVSMPKPQLQ